MATAGRFFYESLTLNSAGTFFTDRKSGGGRCSEVTVIRGSTVVDSIRMTLSFKKIKLVVLGNVQGNSGISFRTCEIVRDLLSSTAQEVIPARLEVGYLKQRQIQALLCWIQNRIVKPNVPHTIFSTNDFSSGCFDNRLNVGFLGENNTQNVVCEGRELEYKHSRDLAAKIVLLTF